MTQIVLDSHSTAACDGSPFAGQAGAENICTLGGTHTKGQDTQNETQNILLTVSFCSTMESGQLKDVRVRHTTDFKVVPMGLHEEHLYIHRTRELSG